MFDVDYEIYYGIFVVDFVIEFFEEIDFELLFWIVYYREDEFSKVVLDDYKFMFIIFYGFLGGLYEIYLCYVIVLLIE